LPCPPVWLSAVICVHVDSSTDGCYEYVLHFLADTSLYTGLLGYYTPYNQLTSTKGTRPNGDVTKHRCTRRLTRSGSCERRRVTRSCSKYMYSCSLQFIDIVLYTKFLIARISGTVGRSSLFKRREISRTFAVSLISYTNYH
jgi:hypothetical protein